MRLQQAGLSLVELMISITLGLVLMTGVVQIFLSSKTVFSTQQGLSRIQEAGRLGIEFLSRDIRAAAYYGCHRPNPNIPGKELQNGAMVIDGLHGNFAEGVRGYDSAADLPGGAIRPVIPGTSNVIVIRSANQVGLPINGVNNANGIFAFSPNPPDARGCFQGICDGSAAVVNDCYKARVFRVSGAPTLAGNTAFFAHGASWGGAGNWMENFATGEILAMNTVVYFLATGVSGAPSLWQRVNDETAVELLEGVAQMRITYATQDNNAYRLAGALLPADWDSVHSVRIELVVRSAENNLVDAPQPFTLGGENVIPPPVDGIPDRYLRQVFTSTIGIRSRATNIP